MLYNMKSRKHKLIYSDKKQVNGYLGLGKVSTERSEGYHQGARQDFWEWRVYLLFWLWDDFMSIHIYQKH